jgi:hypothetical protein
LSQQTLFFVVELIITLAPGCDILTSLGRIPCRAVGHKRRLAALFAPTLALARPPSRTDVGHLTVTAPTVLLHDKHKLDAFAAFY